MLQSLLKSVLHNVFVVAVGFAFALLGTGVDKVFGFARFDSAATLVVGVTLLTAGILLRVWAAYHFYKYRMNVIVLSAQSHLITTGPYRFSRNLGGNVFIFLGTSFILGTLGVSRTARCCPICCTAMKPGYGVIRLTAASGR